MGVWSLLKISLHIQNYVNFVKEDSKMNILFHYPGKNGQLYSHCVVPENIHTPPPTGDHWKFRGGGGVQRQLFPMGGSRGFMGNYFFQTVINHEKH